MIALVAVVLAPVARAAGEAPPPEIPRYGGRRFVADTKYFLTRPAHMGREGWIKVAAVAGATLALYGMRDEIRDYAQNHESDGLGRVLDGARTMGKGGFAPAVALALWLAGYGTGNPREREAAQLVLESAGFSAIGAGIGQFVLSTERPYEGDDIRFLRSGGHGVSADAALAASIVPPLRRTYLVVREGDGTGLKVWKRTATGLLYAGAVLTALQRVESDAHWAPDAFLGTTIGLSVGETLSTAHGIGRKRSVRISLAAVPRGAGLLVRLGPSRPRTPSRGRS